jgi:hypothetical protein
MVKRKRHVAVDLSFPVFMRSMEFGLSHGIPLSRLVEQGLELRLDSPPILPDCRVREVLPGLLKVVMREELLQLLPEILDARGLSSPAPIQSRRSSLHGPRSTVDVPSEVAERLRAHNLERLMDVTSLPKTSISTVRSGQRTRVRAETYDEILRGLERLERPPGETSAPPRRATRAS